jgi:segregation and condensation protein B
MSEPEDEADEQSGIEEDLDEQPEVVEEENESTESQKPAEPVFAEPEEPIETTVESVIEAILFASDESLSATKLAAIVEVTTKQVGESVKTLNERYKANNNAFRIVQIAGGYQMLTLSPYNHWLKKLVRARSDSKLSAAALETLAIIAYKQPIIRADIEAIRGVAAGEMIRSLMYKGLVKITGHADVLGRPMLYGTTRKFLEVFGLNSLKDLPKIEELKKPES